MLSVLRLKQKSSIFHPIDSTLENQRVKLSLLGMSNYKYLLEIAKQHLVHQSPSKIDTPKI
jgi:hypothetical protein